MAHRPRDVSARGDDGLAARLRGFGPAGLLSMLAILLAGNIGFGGMVALPAGGLLVLAWVRLSRTPWRAVGYVPPKNWIVTLTGGVGFGIIFKIVIERGIADYCTADDGTADYTLHSLAVIQMQNAFCMLSVAGGALPFGPK